MIHLNCKVYSAFISPSFWLFLVFSSVFSVKAQRIDVQHYSYTIELNDTNDTIVGKAAVTVDLQQHTDSFSLDLVQVAKEGKGMKVMAVNCTAQACRFTQNDNRLWIGLPENLDKRNPLLFQISYSGVPADGLIISKNKWGDRSFFADNWPDRAHNWIPCNDRPDDKASFEFTVIAPQHYTIISNGIKTEEKTIAGNKKLTHWKEDTPLSTKVMVIGAADFAVKTFADSPAGTPVSAWVYPKDSAKGFYDYAVATDILQFFSSYIAPFPYKKLANVQSKTAFGGMENAGAIFYNEQYVTGDRRYTDVIAHEIAHQWFGDMASEKSFAHLWLSEGFATYLTDIYFEKSRGRDSAVSRLKQERDKVIRFAKTPEAHAVVDSATAFMSLLNANSYEKGAWILHMLRQQTGDSIFRKIIQAYYNRYKGGNADTRDFETVAENVYGKNLRPFFDQWLYTPGIPVLSARWEYKKDSVTVTVKQLQKVPFSVPLELGFMNAGGQTDIRKTALSKEQEVFTFNVKEKPVRLVLDPDTKLLFEEK